MNKDKKINMVLAGVVDRAQTQYQTEPETEPHARNRNSTPSPEKDPNFQVTVE
jgi:hypothetical protein